jgi:hypothetical protein
VTQLNRANVRLSEILLCVYGRGPFESAKYGLSLSVLKKIFRNDAKDRHLEIIVAAQDEDEIMLRVYTDRGILQLENIGIKKLMDEERHLNYYELTLPYRSDVASAATDTPLLCLLVLHNGLYYPIDVTHDMPLASLQLSDPDDPGRVKSFVFRNVTEASMIMAIKDMNRYMSGLAHHSANNVCNMPPDSVESNNFSLRLKSWINILKLCRDVMQDQSVPNFAELMEHFKKSILKEANYFEKNNGSTRYVKLLRSFAETVHPKISPVSPAFSNQLLIYIDMYKQLHSLRVRTLMLDRQPGLFEHNPQLSMAREIELYRLMHDKLAPDDKREFPAPVTPDIKPKFETSPSSSPTSQFKR